MSTTDRNALNLPGQQAKDITPNPTNRVRLAALRGYLHGLLSLDFTDKGRRNICARFGLSEDELSAAMAAMPARPGRPTVTLLHTIGAAISSPQQAKGGTEPW